MKKLIFYSFSLFVLSFTFFSCEQQELDPTAGAAKSEATLAEAEVPEGFNYSTTKKVDIQLELVYNDLPMKSEAFELYSDKELTNLLLTATTDDEGMFSQELNLPQHISTLYMKQLTEEGTENGRVASFGRIFTILLQSFTFKRCDFSEDLQLTSMCSDDPDVERRWRVRNPNNFALRFSWNLASGSQSGEGTAEPGDSFFTTTTEEGPNTLILNWMGNDQEEKSTTKASGGAACNSENLQLTSMCSETPDVRNWRIRNPNNESFTVSWKVYGTEHAGTIEVPEGDVYFTTPAVQGNNTVKIFWQDRLGNNKSSTKASMNRLCKVEKLKLTSVCSDDAQVRRWRIRNPNGFEVSVNWQLYGAGVSGSLQAPAGDSFFTTPANSGVNTVKIFWKDEEGNTKQKTKASSNKLCSTVYYFPGENKYGSLAYEDLWPNRGDYDFNDVVVDFNIMAVYKGQFIDHLKLSFKLKTNGTIYKNGFGIHMPVPAESIENVSGTVRSSNTIQDMGNGVEGGHNADGTSTIIIFDDASALVEPFTHPANPYEINVMIDFKGEVGFDLVEDFVGGLNPFIFVNNRGKEVHLANMLPTSLADESLLGTRADVTQLPNTSYVTSNGLPWAIYTPVSFSYPKEEVEITKAYPAFQAWAESGGTSNVSWYLSPLTSEIED